MTLRLFLETFDGKDIQVTIIDGGVELITFKASGYHCLDDELEAREILKWEIISPIAIKIKLVSETSG